MALGFGLGRLRLAPQTFWAMTPRELLELSGPLPPSAATDRPALAALMQRWPDRPS
jgi:uncharacterized phage protein (TIGR02216 family)